MTIEKLLSEVNLLVPNSLEKKTLLTWLSRFEHQLKVEVFDNYTDEVEYTVYDENTTATKKLLVKPPYDEIYVRYLEAQIHRYLEEYSKYNNCMAECNAIYDRFKAEYCRTHTHKGVHKYTYYGG